ncbi:MAG: dTDP-4-dehydrorhamnose reductase [Algicola sp.]|nr:dTDP-4-dehydrorhamnose reductase [Algicola sp.]
MIHVLVTGANGQLARSLKDLKENHSNVHLIFKNSNDLDITNAAAVNDSIIGKNIDFCVNCAAYTAVDKAESDQVNAFNVNHAGVKNLAVACAKADTILIHISTDFVFDGEKSKAYNESDSTNPINIYGLSKLKGEEELQEQLNNYYILRTSWLYSEHASNFMKTMLRLSETKEALSVVADQIGTPTYTADLAETIFKIIESNTQLFGVYHYSNEGVASWYDFAKAIFEETQKPVKVTPIKSQNYPTPAKRPAFSVMDKEKIKTQFHLEIPHWRDSLKIAIDKHIKLNM